MKLIVKDEATSPSIFCLKSRSFYYLFYFFFITASPLVSEKLPDWASSIPSDDRYYYGVGHAAISEKKYEQIADEVALKVISRQIRTDVYSESEKLIVEEDDITVINKEASITSIISMADIPGAKKEDSKIAGGNYYVLWKLDSEKYLDYIKQNRERSIELYNNFLKAEKSDPIEQLSYLIPCFENVSRSVGIDYTQEEIGVDLVVEVPKIIKEIISYFSLSSEKEDFTGIMRQPLNDPIEVQVRYREQTSTGHRIIRPEGIPISIQFLEGEATIASNTVSTDEEGNSVFRITEISPINSYNSFYAYIDLIALRSDKRFFPSFEAILNNITDDRIIPFTLKATETELYKVAHILVSDDLDQNNLTLLRGSFRAELSKNGTYRIIREANVLKKINDWEREGRNVCTDRDCQLEIGRELKVNKLIFNQISFNSEIITCHMFLTNIDDQEILFEKSYDLELITVDGTNEDKVVKYLKENIVEIVSHFFRMANRGSINLSLGKMSNVMAEIEKINPQRWDDKNFKETLPTGDLKLLAGQYKIELYKPGFEKRKIIQSIGERQKNKPRQSEIMLVQKLPNTAIKKSLIFPGRGQRYQAEPGYESRKTVGMIFSAAAIGGLTLTTVSWSKFFSAKSEYTDANTTYLAQKLLEDVVEQRNIAQQKSDQMLKARNGAIGATLALVGIWVSSALEAKYRSPDYNVGQYYSQGSVNLNLIALNGSFEPGINFSWSL